LDTPNILTAVDKVMSRKNELVDAG
jgi:hypothetical protein